MMAREEREEKLAALLIFKDEKYKGNSEISSLIKDIHRRLKWRLDYVGCGDALLGRLYDFLKDPSSKWLELHQYINKKNYKASIFGNMWAIYLCKGSVSLGHMAFLVGLIVCIGAFMSASSLGLPVALFLETFLVMMIGGLILREISVYLERKCTEKHWGNLMCSSATLFKKVSPYISQPAHRPLVVIDEAKTLNGSEGIVDDEGTDTDTDNDRRPKDSLPVFT